MMSREPKANGMSADIVPFVPELLIRSWRKRGDLENSSSAFLTKWNGAALVCDVSGYTSFSEQLSNAEVGGVGQLAIKLQSFYSEAIEIIHANNGDIVKFAGDALLTVFVRPEVEISSSPPEETCANDSTLAASAHEAALAAILLSELKSADFSFKCGAAIGSFHFAVVQSESAADKFSRCECMVMGRTMEEAWCCESSSKPGAFVAAKRMWELVEPTGDFVATGEAGGGTMVVVSRAREFGARLAPEPLKLNFLENACFEKKMLTFVPAHTLNSFASNDVAMQFEDAEARTCTVMFACFDVVSGESGQSDESILAGIQEPFAQATAQVHKMGGVIRQFIVDDKGLVMISAWGLRESTFKNDGERCVCAALAIERAIATNHSVEVAERKSVAIGICRGRCLCGVIGTKARREWVLVGDTVNTAARLMSVAKKGLLSGEGSEDESGVTLVEINVFENAGLPTMYEIRGEVTFKGKSQPTQMFRPNAEEFGTDADKAYNLRIQMSNRKMSNVSLFQPQSESAGEELWDDEQLWDDESPIVGRHKHLKAWGKKLKDFVSLEQTGNLTAERPNLEVVLIEGSMGLGKTALIERFLRDASSIRTPIGGRLRVCAGRAKEGDRWTYAPWSPIISRMIGIDHKDPIQTQHEAMKSFLDGGSDSYSVDLRVKMLFPILKQILRLNWILADSGQAVLDENQNYAVKSESLNRFEENRIKRVDTASSVNPDTFLSDQSINQTTKMLLYVMDMLLDQNRYVACIEDVHFMDHCSWELLFSLARHACPGKLLMLLSSRPREQVIINMAYETLTKKLRNLTHVVLSPLSKFDIKEIVVHHSQDLPNLAEETIAAVYDVTKGNPFWVGQVLRCLVTADESNSSGLSGQTNGDGEDLSESSSESIRRVMKPETIHSVCIDLERLIISRFDNLSAGAQTLLKIASVAGETCSEHLLKSICPSKMRKHISKVFAEIFQSGLLTNVQNRGMWNELSNTIQFEHSLVQRSIYNLVAESFKRKFHRSVGNYYERTFLDDLRPYYSLMLHHFLLAKIERKKVVKYGTKAAWVAFNNDSDGDGIDLAYMVLPSVTTLDEAKILHKLVITQLSRTSDVNDLDTEHVEVLGDEGQNSSTHALYVLEHELSELKGRLRKERKESMMLQSTDIPRTANSEGQVQAGVAETHPVAALLSRGPIIAEDMHDCGEEKKEPSALPHLKSSSSSSSSPSETSDTVASSGAPKIVCEEPDASLQQPRRKSLTCALV